MTVLVPMRPEVFPSYQESSVAAYAKENVEAERWPAEGAIARSQAEFSGLLPRGLATPDHFLFEIKDAPEGETVGVLWFGVLEKSGLRSAFVFDVEVAPAFRRRGHGRAAFAALERIVQTMGLTKIGLHVFRHNPGAQALYESLGFRVTGMNMIKAVDPVAAR
jgi:ribosomal protein S18 acetylase RimI-like enzyme